MSLLTLKPTIMLKKIFKNYFRKPTSETERIKAATKDTDSGKLESLQKLGYKNGLLDIPLDLIKTLIEEDNLLTHTEQKLNDVLKEINGITSKGEELALSEKLEQIHKVKLNIEDKALKINQSQAALEEIISGKTE